MGVALCLWFDYACNREWFAWPVQAHRIFEKGHYLSVWYVCLWELCFVSDCPDEGGLLLVIFLCDEGRVHCVGLFFWWTGPIPLDFRPDKGGLPYARQNMPNCLQSLLIKSWICEHTYSWNYHSFVNAMRCNMVVIFQNVNPPLILCHCSMVAEWSAWADTLWRACVPTTVKSCSITLHGRGSVKVLFNFRWDKGATKIRQEADWYRKRSSYWGGGAGG